MADQSSFNIPWAGLAVVAALVSGSLLAPRAFDQLRPPEKERAQSLLRDDLEIDARLWEDPFFALRRHVNERSWSLSLPIAAAAAAYLLWLIVLAVLLKTFAEQTRRCAIERMEADLRWLRGSPRHAVLQGRFEDLIASVRKISTGAFAGFFEQPLLQALLIPWAGLVARNLSTISFSRVIKSRRRCGDVRQRRIESGVRRHVGPDAEGRRRHGEAADQGHRRRLAPRRPRQHRYNGSLITPPCTEGVRWLVMKESMTAAKGEIDTFRSTLGFANNRPVQAINARPVLE